jgi:hypothetical protein
MPQIIVAADRGAAFGEGAVTFRERVNVADFESQHFAAQLLERLGWAVEDADQAEQTPDAPTTDADRGADPTAAGPDSIEEQPEPQQDEREMQRDERLSVPSPA